MSTLSCSFLVARMGRRKTTLAWTAALMLLLVLLAPGAAQAQPNCVQTPPDAGELRSGPYCINAPGSPMPTLDEPHVIGAENKNSVAERDEQLSCPDGTTFGKT